MASSLLDLDPTGTLSAVGAGVSLVGAALRLGTAAKKFNDTRNASGASGGGAAAGAAPNLHRSVTNPAEVPVVPKDPERERRAYETVNFVLREFGSRICAAGMVDEHALTKALTAATQHIEVNLFSGEANRLFESLAPKLNDPILVNSVFTSIYFIGALSAELSTSLPNYKDTYTPIGPRLVQQLFRAAIGEDAFRDNLSANLDAYKTLTTTAGLLRPTDIGYATFPKFPSFSPCKYSGRGFADVRHNKTVYEKLVKHFERSGFPQPTQTRQVEVGMIRDWKFLSSDSNSRAFDVDKADKNIGENFGRVLHWLICNAERLPPGTAVIAYYDQHIELIKWIQHRMGYAVLYPVTDLNLGGPHAQLERRLRMTIDSWVILMPSEAAQAAKRANAEHWMSTHIRSAARAPPFVASGAAVPRPMSMANPQVVQIPLPAGQSPPPIDPVPVPVAQAPPPVFEAPPPAVQTASATNRGIPPARQPSQASSNSASAVSVPQSTNPATTTIPTTPPMSSTGSPPRSPVAVEMPIFDKIQTPKTAEQQVEEIDQQFRSALVPQFLRLWSYPSSDAGIRDSQCKVLDHTLERETVDRLDRIEIPENSSARMHRKRLIDQAQELMDFLPAYKELGPLATHGRPLPGALQALTQQSIPSGPTKNPALQRSESAGYSPPPYSPDSNPSTSSNILPTPTHVLEKGKPTAIRRKAPPPPKKIIPAKALYDFEPDIDNDEELGFNEDDDIEIIEKTAAMDEDGWCRARIKGSKRIGLVPLEYLKIEEKPSAPSKAPSQPPAHSVPPSGNVGAQVSPRQIPVAGNPKSIDQALVHHLPGTPLPSASTHHQPGVPSHPSFVHQQTTATSLHSTSHGAPSQSHAPPKQTITGSALPAAHDITHGPPPAAHTLNSQNTKVQAAGLASAAIGAVTGVGALLKASGKLDGEKQQLHAAGPSSKAGLHSLFSHGGGQSSDRNQYTPNSGIQNLATNTDNNGTTVIQDSQPAVDLSAFGEAPFSTQTPVTSQEQFFVPQESFASQTTEADYNTSGASTTEVLQENSTTNFVDGPGPGVSPFASLATTSAATTTTTTDTTTYTDTIVTGGDGNTSVFESISEDQFVAVDNGSGNDDDGFDC